MQYEIVATLGPVTNGKRVWRQLLDAGASAVRLNSSHLSLAELEEWLVRLQPVLNDAPGAHVVLDLQGSKWRLGRYPAVTIAEGERLRLAYTNAADRPGVLPVPHSDFFRAVEDSPGVILLNDAKTRLRAERCDKDSVDTVVERGGELSGHKGLSVPGSRIRSEGLQAKDRDLLTLTEGGRGYGGKLGDAAAGGRVPGCVRYALSYVRDGQEMAVYRRVFGSGAYLIAKLERREALDDAAAIAEHADELWLCRGDLGAELGLAEMARAAGAFGLRVRSIGRPVLLAGQVLEHMSSHPTPTRAEVCGLYDALAAGYGGIVLSDETAVGAYALESCRAAALFRGLAGR